MSNLQYVATGMSGAAIEAVADRVRQFCGLNDTDYLPVIQILEWALPKMVDGFTYDIREPPEMGPNHGLTMPDRQLLLLRSDVYDGLVAGRGRDRFTTCHEIGHLILHPDRRLSRTMGQGPIKPYMDPEWQANRFASAFLMPRHLIKKYSSVAEIANEFGVTKQAAEVRAKILNMQGVLPY